MPVSENFEIKTNAPTPVIDADVTKVLNNIYGFLQKQSNEISAARKEAAARGQKEEANNRAVQNALSDMSKTQAKGPGTANAPASNNRAVEAALKDILKGQRSSDVRDMAEDRKNRAVNNALFAKLDKTTGAIGTLQSALTDILKNLASIIGSMAKESLRSYDDNVKSMRKLFLTSDQIKADLLKGDKAKEALEKYNIKVSSSETKGIMTALREAGADTAQLSEDQIAAITMMNKTMGTDVKTALALTASSKDPTKLIAMAVRAADVTGKAATVDLLSKTTQPWFDQFAKQVGGNEQALLKFQSVAKQLDSALGMYGLNEKTQSDIVEQMAKISSGQLEGVNPDKLVDLLSISEGDLSDPEKFMAGLQKAIESGNSENLRALKEAGMSEDLVSSLLKAQAAFKDGNYIKKDIRSDQGNLEGVNQAVKGGKVGNVVDNFITGINTATGGIFSNLAVDLNEMFGDNVSMESVVSSGFKMVIGILGAMLASKIFKGPIDLLKKGLGGALGGGAAAGAKAAGKGAANAAAGTLTKSTGILAKIGSAIGKIVAPLTKAFPFIGKIAGVALKFLGPIGWVITALKAGFSAGKWLVKMLFPGVYLTMQKAGGYIGALKEIGSFIKDKFMEFYTGSIQPLVANIVQMYNDHIKPLVETVGGILADVVTNIWDGTMWFFSEKLPNLFLQLFDLGKAVLDLGSAFSDLVGSGIQVIWSYINIGITAISNVPTLICGKVQEIYFTLKEFLLGKIKDLVHAINGIPGVNVDDLEASLEASEKKAGNEKNDAIAKQNAALAEVAQAIAEKDSASADFDSKLTAMGNAIDGVKEAASNIGNVDETYEEYHKKKEDERDRDRKELEEWEKKNAAKSNGLLDKIAENTKPEETVDIFANLPGLSDGGLISSTTPAIVGEAGREAVLPLTKPGELKKVLGSLSGSDKFKLLKSLISGDSSSVASLLGSSAGPQLPSAANGVPGDDPATINKILGYAGPYRDMVYDRMLHGWKGKTKDGFKQRKKWFDEALANAANQEGRDLIRGTYAERALDYGVSELGKPYILRSLGKIGYVCNELVNACVQKSGFDMKKFRVHGVKATFANIQKGKYSDGNSYPDFRIRDDLTPETAIPGMVFFQDARKNQEGGFQPGHIGLVYYGHQKLHAAGGSANYTKEGFLPNWQTPCRGVTVTPFDGSNYVIGEFPGMFEQTSGEWKPPANSSVSFGPGISDAALKSSVEANMSSIEDAGLLSNEQISSVLANASGADAKLAASYAAEAAKLMNGSNKEEIIAILTEIARTIRGIAISKKPMMSVNRPAISTY